MLRLTAFVIATAITLSISASSAARQATPFALPATPNPVECGIEPRAGEDIARLLATPAAVRSSRGTPVSGVPADHAVTAFAVSIVREALACGNAHGFPGVAALLSDRALLRDVLGRGLPAAALTFAERGSIPSEAARRALVDVRDVVSRDDGRVGVVAVIEDPEHGLSEVQFTLVLAEGVAGASGSEQYLFLIDGVDTIDGATGGPNAGTPAP